VNDKKNTLTIMGLVVLIALLVVGIRSIFLGLELVLPTKATTAQTELLQDAEVPIDITDAPVPSYCPHCGEKLPESFQWDQFCPYCGEKVVWEAA
jgi:Zn finger protein HypA/HybF involved in hydrogenase expression